MRKQSGRVRRIPRSPREHPVKPEESLRARETPLGDGIVAQVEIQSGLHRLVSLVSREAVDELGIEVGVTATARVKSTDVPIDRP